MDFEKLHAALVDRYKNRHKWLDEAEQHYQEFKTEIDALAAYGFDADEECGSILLIKAGTEADAMHAAFTLHIDNLEWRPMTQVWTGSLKIANSTNFINIIVLPSTECKLIYEPRIHQVAVGVECEQVEV